MKKKILVLSVVGILIVMLLTLTGCGNKTETVSDNTNQTVDNNVDEGEKIIYEFARYVREQDINKITNVFELAKVKGDELKGKLEEYFKSENATNYNVTEVYRIENEQEFVKNIKEKTLTYDLIQKMIDTLGDNEVVPYIVRGTQSGTEFEDIFYLKNENGTYKIIHSTAWNFILY